MKIRSKSWLSEDYNHLLILGIEILFVWNYLVIDGSRSTWHWGVWSLQRRGFSLTKRQIFHDYHLCRLWTNYMTYRNSNSSCSTFLTLTCILSIFLWMYSVNVLVTGKKQCLWKKSICFLAFHKHNVFYYIIVKCYYRHFSFRKIPPLMQFLKILFALKEANKCRHSMFLVFNWVPVMCPD